MSRTTLDLWVGFFVAVGLGALLFLALKVGNLASSSSGETYAIQAKFDNIGGLKVRGAVKSAGVVVGRVTEIRFDPEAYLAVVTINLSMPATSFRAIHSRRSIRRVCSASSTWVLKSVAIRRC
jgi:phospholipid/cholesterol/gamma-HCH transport system substrate-binding protein